MMGSRVLLADDSVTIQKVVGIIFANEGYTLTVVDTGDAAVARARELKPDVMLVDALMPGKNGYEVCREIRQDPALAHTAILLMTGAFEVVDEEKNRQSGADEFITKPFESQALIDVTNRLIALTAERLAKPAAAPQPSAPEPPPLAAAPLQAVAPSAPAVDDIWATGFDEEPAAAPAAADFFAAAEPAPAPVTPAPVKVTADDDLWGAFDMDDIETVPAPVAAAADVFTFEAETPVVAPAAAEEAFVLEDVAFEEPAASGFEPVGEQEISFGEFEPAALETVQAAQPVSEDAFGDISFDEPETPVAVAAAVPPPLMPPTPVEPPAPVVEAAAPAFEPPAPVFEAAAPVFEAAAPVFEAAAPVFEAAPQSAPLAAPEPAAPAVAPAGPLDEAQLKSLLSSVSREVIERIVWEVVPDLAETIIKEEIRKLKAGIA
jgi:CheY-like chemotaxis protein